MIDNLTVHFQFREFIAEMVYNYAAAWVLALLFESPTVALDKWAWSRPREQKRPIDEKLEKNENGDTTELQHVSTIRLKLWVRESYIAQLQ